MSRWSGSRCEGPPGSRLRVRPDRSRGEGFPSWERTTFPTCPPTVAPVPRTTGTLDGAWWRKVSDLGGGVVFFDHLGGRIGWGAELSPHTPQRTGPRAGLSETGGTRLARARGAGRECDEHHAHATRSRPGDAVCEERPRPGRAVRNVPARGAVRGTSPPGCRVRNAPGHRTAIGAERSEIGTET
jgi:hypothetical protein